MASIPGIIYIILGILVSASSYVLNNRNQSNALTMFIFIGLIFIIIGTIKLVINRPMEIKPVQRATHAAAPLAPQHTTPNKQTAPQHTSQPQHPTQSPPHTAHAKHPQTAVHQTQQPITSPFINVSPRNKLEQALLQQEIGEANQQAHISHPEIIICKTCGRRQYKTRSTCFVCGHAF